MVYFLISVIAVIFTAYVSYQIGYKDGGNAMQRIIKNMFEAYSAGKELNKKEESNEHTA